MYMKGPILFYKLDMNGFTPVGRGSRVLASFIVLESGTGGLDCILTQTTMLSSGLKLVADVVSTPSTLCLIQQQLGGSETVSYDDTASANRPMKVGKKKKTLCHSVSGEKVREVNSCSLHWVRLCSSHRSTDTSSGCSLNLSKCKLVELQHKSLF